MKIPLFASILMTCAVAEEPRLAEPKKIEFQREIWLEIVPPCTLDSEGSKLSVYPQATTFKDFMAIVKWPSGTPGQLGGTSPDAKDFYFDLNEPVTFQKKVVVRIGRTTMRVTQDGTIMVEKGSHPPRILSVEETQRFKSDK